MTNRLVEARKSVKVDGSTFAGSLSEARKIAVDLEALGFDGFFTGETTHDPFLPLAIASEHTERIELGTGIAVAFPRSPMHLANLGHDLQLFSNGRFILGLGSQIKAHVEKRFSADWFAPAARMRELVMSTRAVWRSWNEGERLDFQGDFYTLTLMTPFFSPPASPQGPPRIYVAAVGQQMAQVAGEVADGLFVHPFTTAEYLREVTLPAVDRGRSASSPEKDSHFEVALPVFIVTGDDQRQMQTAAQAVREQLSFYGSTPAYRSVLEQHGWGELQSDLNSLSKQGRWREMADLIDEEILNTFAICGPPDEIGPEIERRLSGVVDRVSFYAPYERPLERWMPTVEYLKAINSRG